MIGESLVVKAVVTAVGPGSANQRGKSRIVRAAAPAVTGGGSAVVPGNPTAGGGPCMHFVWFVSMTPRQAGFIIWAAGLGASED